MSRVVMMSDVAELLLLAIVSAYGRAAGPCLPSTFKRELKRTSAEVAGALNELIEEGVVQLLPDGLVRATDTAFDLPVFVSFRQAVAADPRVVAGFLLIARVLR